MFRHRKGTRAEDPAEARFDSMMELIKDLPKADFNRMVKAMELGWKSYETVRNVKTDEERDNEVTDNADKELEKMEYME